jgi:hypothetical protein
MKKLFLTLSVLLLAFSGLAAIHVKQQGQTDKIYYAHRDHLGSILSLTDANSTAAFKASYDAWGNQSITNNTFKFHRGFTGHELIHAYHYYMLPNTVLYTERVAHQYTYNVYMNSSRIATAMLQLGGMLSNAYAGSYPAQYSIPLIFKFSF